MRGVIPQEPRHLKPASAGRMLQQSLRGVTPQLLVGAVLFAGAMATALLAWLVERPAPVSGGTEISLVTLIAAVVASQWLPIRIGKATQLYFASVPLYLLCCLFAPPIAMAAAGVGMFTRELSICRRCANTPGDVGAQVGRWMLLIFGVSTVVHLWPAGYVLFAGALAAILLWLGDVLTSPFIIPATRGRSAFGIIARAARASYAGELMQYLIALFTLALLRSGVEWIAAFYIPLIVMSLILLYLYLKGTDDLKQLPPVPGEESVRAS